MLLIQRFEHGGNIYQARRRGRPGSISVPISIPGLSTAVKEALATHLDAVVHYPDPKGTALRQPLNGPTASLPILSSWETGQPNSFISTCILFGRGGS